MDEALDQVRKLAAASEDGRRKAMLALQNLAFSLENPHDTIRKYGHMVWSPLSLPKIKTD